MAKVASSDDTIASIATAWGEGAVGIVRLSGPRALEIVDSVFVDKKKRPLANLKTFRMRYGWIVREKGVFLDEVIVSLMRAPKSYTREDVVEISSHGGGRVLANILGLLLQKGARLAEPGEFTRRAFLNGRMDLAQAEAVLDIIRARGDLALSAAARQLDGTLSRAINRLRQELVELLAEVEAAVDFSEEISLEKNTAAWERRLSDISTQGERLLEGAGCGRVIREGFTVVLTGRPNVGKSSLLNALLKHDRAIVTPIAGTTRDTLEESVNIKGLTVRLVDTAGLAASKTGVVSGCPIEHEALERTHQAIEASDLAVFVFDAADGITAEDEALAHRIAARKKIVVINKCDLGCRIAGEDIEALCGAWPLEVSAATGKHIEKLEEAIYAAAFGGTSFSGEGVLLANIRHIEIVRRAQEALARSLASLRQGLSAEFIALDARVALETLGEVTGETFTEDVLDNIFSKFCIGK